MKRSELAFNLASIPIDAGMLLLAGISAFYARLHYSGFIGPVLYDLDISDFLRLAVWVIPFIVLVFAALGLYNLRGTRRVSREFGKVVIALGLSLSLVIILFFFDRSFFPSRFIILATTLLAVVYVCSGRVLLKILQQYAFKKGFGLHRLVLVNGSSQAKGIEAEYLDRRKGFQVVAILDYTPDMAEKLLSLYNTQKFDEIIQANPTASDDVNLKILEFTRKNGLHFSFVPNLFEIQRNIVEVENIAGTPIISIKNTPLDGWGKIAKRILDILGSGAALLILSPIFAVIFVAIKLNSPGPVIYPAIRGGCGKDFKFYKFRSMYAHLSPGLGGEEAEKLRQQLWEKNDRGGKTAPFLKIKNDPRVTKVGKILRKTKLDEIPQFWNVLKGDMSLVGPRAHVLDEVDRYRNEYRRIFSIKPGAFGMSQVAQVNSPDLPFEEEIRLNTYYIENWTLWLDIKILFKSAYLLLFGHKNHDDY